MCVDATTETTWPVALLYIVIRAEISDFISAAVRAVY